MLQQNDTYDCTPHLRPEGIVHHTTRLVHNVLHPHHKHVYIAPLAMVCKAPEMAVVTITAAQGGPWDDPRIDFSLAPGSGAYPLYAGYFPGIASVADAPTQAVSLPEPSVLPMLAVALLATVLVSKLRAEI